MNENIENKGNLTEDLIEDKELIKKRKQAQANMRFEEKTYKKYVLRLRYDIDQSLIDLIEEKKEAGIGITELVRKALWKTYL